jgi:signal transduction histidine kinase
MTRDKHVALKMLRFDCEGKICLDPTRIMQVVRNLLGNALKFSPQGASVEINARRQGGSLIVSVSDEGPGIPENEVESIFDKFIQSSKTSTGAGGTGLGLAICREIVAGHGGRIWAENKAGIGAVFFFTIPLAESNVTAIQEEVSGEVTEYSAL